MLRAIHSFENTDSTKVFNDSWKDILPMGIYSGGDVISNGSLSVRIQPFAAKTFDGMTLREDNVDQVIEIPATGDVWRVGIVAKYIPANPSVIQPLAIKESDFGTYPDRDYYITFATVDLSAGNTNVLPENITNINRDEPGFLNPDRQTSSAIIQSLYAGTLETSQYEFITFDTFVNNSRVDQNLTTMGYNSVSDKYRANAAGLTLATKDVVTNKWNPADPITEVVVVVDTDDPAPIVRIKSNAAAPLVAGTANTVIQIPGGNAGSELYLEIESSGGPFEYNGYGILYKRVTDRDNSFI